MSVYSLSKPPNNTKKEEIYQVTRDEWWALQTPWEQSSSTSLTYSFHRDGEYSYFPLPSPLAKKNKAENNMELY